MPSFQGNPMPTGDDAGATPDPGFRQPIFDAVYSGSTTQDTRYSIPDGVNVRQCRGTCRSDFKSKEIIGTKSYKEALSSKTTLTFAGFGAKFSASIDFKHVEDETRDAI